MAVRRVVMGLVVLLVAVAGCGPLPMKLSVKKTDRSAGLNGSFEIVKSGYPANWRIRYQPIKNGDVDLSFDAVDPIDGKQSLKFIVYRANPIGGWRTAGLFHLPPAKENHSYQVSFWLKNRGCKVRVFIESEKYVTDIARHPIDLVLGEEEMGTDTWRKFEYTYTVPPTFDNIRFDIMILEPGTLWIDDVRIEEVQTKRQQAGYNRHRIGATGSAREGQLGMHFPVGAYSKCNRYTC